MGIFGICAEAQQPVDQAIKDWGLHFQVCVPDCVCVCLGKDVGADIAYGGAIKACGSKPSCSLAQS